MKINMKKYKKNLRNNGRGIVVESGEYEVLIEQFKLGVVKSEKSKFKGSDSLGLMLRIRDEDINPKYKKVVVWDNITLENPNENYRVLQLLDVLGLDEEFDPKDLVGKEVRVVIDKTPRKVRRKNKKTGEVVWIDMKDETTGEVVYQNRIKRYEESYLNEFEYIEDEDEDDDLDVLEMDELDMSDEDNDEDELESDSEEFYDVVDEEVEDNEETSEQPLNEEYKNDDSDEEDDLMDSITIS